MTDMFTMLTPYVESPISDLLTNMRSTLPLLGYTRYLHSLVYKAILCIVDR